MARRQRSGRGAVSSHRYILAGALALLLLVCANVSMVPPPAILPVTSPGPRSEQRASWATEERATEEGARELSEREEQDMRFIGAFPGCLDAIAASNALDREGRAAAQSEAFPTCPRVDEYEFPWPPTALWRIASNPDPPQYPVCGWVPADGRYPMRGMDAQGNAPHTKVVSFFNDLNLTVTLKGGGALGALRHGGPIPRDHDVDLVLPVWLNLDRRQLPCPQAGDGTSGPLRHAAHEAFLCGLDRNGWVREVKRFLTPHLERAGMRSRVTEYGGLRLMGRAFMGVDLVVSIRDSWVIPEKLGGGICRCPWGGVDALCVENEHEHMQHEYGPGYMTPDRRSATAAEFS